MDWSPEQIAGRLRLSGDISVSFSWLYRRIHQDRAAGVAPLQPSKGLSAPLDTPVLSALHSP